MAVIEVETIFEWSQSNNGTRSKGYCYCSSQTHDDQLSVIVSHCLHLVWFTSGKACLIDSTTAVAQCNRQGLSRCLSCCQDKRNVQGFQSVKSKAQAVHC